MPKKGFHPLLTTQDVEIAEARAKGQTLQEIANTHGLDPSVPCRRLQRPEMIELVERLHADLINTSLDTSIDNLRHVVKVYQTTPKDDPQLREHGYKTSVRIAESVGILPSRTPSTLVQQIYNQSGDITITTELDQLSQFLRHQWSVDAPDMVDVTPQIEGKGEPPTSK
ncbi:MAG TPA: hypothetical protein ACFYD4_08415 [Candidatus Wunengus sp. YC61]|uniref:hypothetical protein n=1 Tax=Candidatus Wunengus sp. YC61 TaxID=3367698 RepID=UPI004025F678